MWESAGTFSWENITDEAINYILISNSGAASGSTGLSGINIDNILITSECDNQVGISSTIEAGCIGSVVEIEYEICIVGNDNTPTDVILEASLPAFPGVQYGGGDFINGEVVINGIVPNGECAYVTLLLDVDNSFAPGTEIPVLLDVTTSNACIGDPTGLETIVVLEEDPFVQALTCPCECNEFNIVLPGETVTLSSLISQGVLPLGGLFDFSCLAIGGTLVIDNNLISSYTIGDGSIKMQPGSEIVVENNAQLTIGFTEISGCETMWRGITVEPGGKLDFYYNTIQDAQYAISATSTQSQKATLNIGENIFDRNHIGIYVPNNSGTVQQILQPFPMINNTFTCTAGIQLLPSFDPIDNWEIDHSYAGIEVHESVLLIGSYNEYQPNVFSNIRNGIIGDYSVLGVYGNHFLHLVGEFTGLSIPPWSDSYGVGVLTKSCFVVADANWMYQVNGGLFANNSTLLLTNNMISAETGVRTTSVGSNISYFNLNYISYDHFGIYLQLSNAAPNTRIKYNTFEKITGVEEFFVGAAIRVGGNSNIVSPELRILSNKIEIDNPSHGIEVSSTSGWGVHNNDINISDFTVDSPAGSWAGIKLGHSDYNYLNGNKINSFATSNNQQNAIIVSNSEWNTLCCNSTNGSRWGLTFSGACDNTKLLYTNIGTHNVGFNCGQLTMIGDQTHSGNRWNGTYDPTWAARHNGGFFEIAGSEFRVESPVELPLWPSDPTSPNNPDNWFFPWAGSASNCKAGDSFNCPTPPTNLTGGGDDKITDNDISIASGNFSGNSNGGNMLDFEGKRGLYNRMKKYESDLLGFEPVTDQFYANNLSTSVNDFNWIETAVMDVLYTSESTANETGLLTDSGNQLLDSILIQDSLLTIALNGVDSSIIMNNKMSLLSEIRTMFNNLLELNKQEETNKQIMALEKVNNYPSPSQFSVQESNYYIVNKILLEHIGQGTDQLSESHFAEISPIAWQCPLEGGDAVYQARELYLLNETRSFNDDSLCVGLVVPYGEEEVNAMVIEESINLIPNPANDQVTIEVVTPRDESIYQIRMTNLMGQILSDNSVVSNQRWQYSTEALPNGVYFCILLKDGKPITSKKMIIQH